MRCNVLNKVNFIKELNEVIVKYHGGVNSVEYIVFKHKETEHMEEFLVITYEGGAKSIRNCSGNSFSAVFEELSRYLDTGYYSELEYFRNIENDPNWIKVVFE